MTKVHNVGPPATITRSIPVRLNRLSLLYNLVFVVKLATTPFFAYLSEPFPWAIPSPTYPAWNTTTATEFTTTTTAYLETIYNNRTLPPTAVCVRDVATNSHVVRFRRSLPPSDHDCTKYLVRLPGAGLYGAGMRRLVCTFVADSDTGRTHRRHCDHVHVAGLPVGDICLWFEATTQTHEYLVYHAFLIWENRFVCWGKLFFRCALTSYILRVLWRRYYSHYPVLIANLQTMGIDDIASPEAIEILVGDPSYPVLSDPFVSIVMDVDIWLGIAYWIIAVERASQYQDWWSFGLGCMYTARYVWTGYLMMWVLSRAVKRLGWEASFSPVDPAHLGMSAYFYGGPMLLLVGNTSAMLLMQDLWDVAVPASGQGLYIEALPGCVFWSVIMALVPVVASTFWGLVRRFRRLFVASTRSALDVPSKRYYCPRMYNDLNSMFFFNAAMCRVPYQVRLDGGALYTLIERHPRYRRMPLFSHRGADCCVLVYQADGVVMRQIRLCLLPCLDFRPITAVDAILACTSPAPAAYCSLSTAKCALCKDGLGNADGKLRLHTAANACKWVLCPSDIVKDKTAQQ